MTALATDKHPLCDQILPHLYLGPLEAEQLSLENLRLLGITHVLRLGCSFFPKSHARDLQYLEVDVFDRPESDLLSITKKHDCNGFIDKGRAHGGILVHCIAGISRSAAVVTAYIMCREHLGFSQALALVKAQRPRASPNAGFCEQLKVLEVECDCNMEKYVCAPDFPYLTPAERTVRGKQWLAQRQAAASGVAPLAPGPWRAKRINPILPPTEDI